jgi:hypothetical protein
VRLEGLGKLKKLIVSLGLEPATLGHLSQRLNHLRVPLA